MTVNVKAWLALGRLPFHSVGVMPFILGTIMAWRFVGIIRWPVVLWAMAAVVLIMLATYLNGECYDIVEDRLAAEQGKNPFSGGSQIVVRHVLPRSYPRLGAIVSISLAMAIGLLLQFYFRTGPWTIPLGACGVFAGFFYSAPPFRWVGRGCGELLIGFCYGWLPVATAFYLQSGRLTSVIHWLTPPIACTIFNVILINEFLDRDADERAGKRNLAVRLGLEKSAVLYVLAAALSVLFVGVSILKGVPRVMGVFYLPFLAISLFLIAQMLRRRYRERRILLVLCGLTIVLNLGVSLSYSLAYLLGR